MVVFDALERQIVAALQLDPRCPWRKIAAVLGEAERTVARKGSELLESGAVAVVGIRPKAAVVLVEMRCMPGTVRAAVQALSQRQDTTFVYTTTGTGDCVAEIITESSRMGDVLSDELPSTIGLRDSTSYPVLRYFRTIRGWRPEVLPAERARRPELGPDTRFRCFGGRLGDEPPGQRVDRCPVRGWPDELRGPGTPCRCFGSHSPASRGMAAEQQPGPAAGDRGTGVVRAERRGPPLDPRRPAARGAAGAELGGIPHGPVRGGDCGQLPDSRRCHRGGHVFALPFHHGSRLGHNTLPA